MPFLPFPAFSTGVSPNFCSKPRQLRSARKDAEKRKHKLWSVIQNSVFLPDCEVKWDFCCCFEMLACTRCKNYRICAKFYNKHMDVWKWKQTTCSMQHTSWVSVGYSHRLVPENHRRATCGLWRLSDQQIVASQSSCDQRHISLFTVLLLISQWHVTPSTWCKFEMEWKNVT